LFIDQLGAMVYHWGFQHGENLRLGYILAGGRCFLIGTPRDGEEGVVTIWITTTSGSGVTGDNSLDHYSGIVSLVGDGFVGGKLTGWFCLGIPARRACCWDSSQ
jgi:hypothetical protein